MTSYHPSCEIFRSEAVPPFAQVAKNCHFGISALVRYCHFPVSPVNFNKQVKDRFRKCVYSERPTRFDACKFEIRIDCFVLNCKNVRHLLRDTSLYKIIDYLGQKHI